MKKKILAVASAGGHWVQLQHLLPAFDGHRLFFATTDRGLRELHVGDRIFLVRDASLWNKIALAHMAFQVALVILLVRPNIVVTTGAAPGYFALAFGKLIGAKTIWIDSIANADELSLAGKRAKRWADHWLTQWPELARPTGPEYWGAVL